MPQITDVCEEFQIQIICTHFNKARHQDIVTIFEETARGAKKAMGTNIHPWVQLRTNTRLVTGNAKIIGGIVEGTDFDIGTVKWDGSAFSAVGENVISASSGLVTYECFDLTFKNFQ